MTGRSQPQRDGEPEVVRRHLPRRCGAGELVGEAGVPTAGGDPAGVGPEILVLSPGGRIAAGYQFIEA